MAMRLAHKQLSCRREILSCPANIYTRHVLGVSAETIQCEQMALKEARDMADVKLPRERQEG